MVDRDKASEGLLASGDERMEKLIEFRQKLLDFRDPANGKRDTRRMNGNQGPGPLLISARRELLTKLLALQEEVHLQLISPEELLLIQQMWKAARDPDDGRGAHREQTTRCDHERRLERTQRFARNGRSDCCRKRH
ncbi:MAG TPA: hypothetical protein VKO18_15780 [Terriglobia bacterium]|nr:hypothetical protein [Terriglobia bacterium]